MRTERSSRRVRGQALIELLVACIALLPMFWAVSLLGKYLNIQDAVINSSRWLAFECTVRVSECQSNPGVITDQARLWESNFSALDAPIRGSGDADRRAHSASRNPLWVDPNNRSLISSEHSVSAEIQDDRFDAGLSVALSTRGAAADAEARMAQAGPTRFALDAQSGLFRFSVAAAVNALNAPGSVVLPALNFTARSSILVDAWNANVSGGSDPDSVEARVELAQDPLPLLLATDESERNYIAIRSLLNRLGQSGLEPLADQFRFRQLDTTVLPEDRTRRVP